METMRTTNDLISMVATAVDRGYKSLTPALRTQCDAPADRVEALAAIAARTSHDGRGLYNYQI